MPARRGRLRRPLLGLRRADTVAACAALGLRPWHDPTNGAADPVDASAPRDDDGSALPLRSQVRHRVLPVLESVLGPGVAEALARTADALRQDAEVLDAQAADLLAAATTTAPATATAATTTAPARPMPTTPPTPHDRPALDVAVLAAAPAALRHRALRSAAVAAGSPPGALHRVHVLRLDALVTDWHGQGPVHLPGQVVGLRVCGRLTFDTP
jgi:hypothetical protein